MTENIATKIHRSKHDRENPYVMINKKMLHDPNLDPQDKGVLAYLLSLPNDWDINLSHLAKVLGTGRDRIRNVINNLIKHGYCLKSENRDARNRYIGTSYEVSEEPIFLNKNTSKSDSGPETENPSVDKYLKMSTKNSKPKTDFPAPQSPAPENPTLLSNDIILKNEKNNILLSEPAVRTVSANAKTLSKFFFSKLKENNPNQKAPNFSTWDKHFDYMLRIDKREFEEIKQVIAWAQADDFWHTNVRSPEKLRQQFDTLIIKMKAKSKDENVRLNRTYAMGVKAKYPTHMRSLVINDKFAINATLGKEISLSMKHEAFKPAFLAAFGAT